MLRPCAAALRIGRNGNEVNAPRPGWASHESMFRRLRAPRHRDVGRVAIVTKLVDVISRHRDLDHPIADRTGLAGTYEFDLTWVPARAGASGADPADVMPLDVALPQLLGLKMAPAKEPRDVVVIDAAERPTPD